MSSYTFLPSQLLHGFGDVPVWDEASSWPGTGQSDQRHARLPYRGGERQEIHPDRLVQHVLTFSANGLLGAVFLHRFYHRNSKIIVESLSQNIVYKDGKVCRLVLQFSAIQPALSFPFKKMKTTNKSHLFEFPFQKSLGIWGCFCSLQATSRRSSIRPMHWWMWPSTTAPWLGKSPAFVLHCRCSFGWREFSESCHWWWDSCKTPAFYCMYMHV